MRRAPTPPPAAWLKRTMCLPRSRALSVTLPAWLHQSAPIDLQAARLFETLYDAAACEDLPRDFALRLQSLLAMPVYDGLARDDHPLFGLLPHLADDAQAPPRDEDRQALLQAALVGSLL
jgi:hypothetical protein